jgi:hypothetical protein
MTISVWGWGSTTISTWGWGTPYFEYIPKLLAYFIESHAYTCITNRDYVEIIERRTGEVLLRLLPIEIPNRGYGEVVHRMQDGDMLLRMHPDQIPDREYIEVLSRFNNNDAIVRIRPNQIPVRERGDVLNRLGAETIIDRSTGWPWQSEPCIDDEE